MWPYSLVLLCHWAINREVSIMDGCQNTPPFCLTFLLKKNNNTVYILQIPLIESLCWTLGNNLSNCCKEMGFRFAWHQFHTRKSYAAYDLTLNVQGLSYLGLARSISWLLMPWLLMSPGHQQPWYWLYRICRSSSYLREDFKYLCDINVEEWHKM